MKLRAPIEAIVGRKRVPVLAIERTKKGTRLRLARKGDFDPRSFRTVKLRKGQLLTIGCPKGGWDPRRGFCKVGTKAQALLRKGRRNPGGPPRLPVRVGDLLLTRIATSYARPTRRNPQWLTGSEPFASPTGFAITRFRDAGGVLVGEMFAKKGEPARFLLEKALRSNPRRRRRRAARR